jgi:conjugative relaxase-like TrwC/TraI family protein
MLSIAKLTAGNEEYYLSLVSYYVNQRVNRASSQTASGEAIAQEGCPVPSASLTHGEPPGQWLGIGAENKGFRGIVEAEDFRKLFQGFHPHSHEPLVQNAGKPERTPGWDLCFTVPKEVSVLWSQAPETLRAEIEEIHQAAIREVVRLIELLFAWSRKGKASLGSEYIPVKLIVAAFQHSTSRANDPNLHTHCIVINIGVDANGKTRALYSKPLFVNKMVLGAYYRAKLASLLQVRLGLQTKQKRRSFQVLGGTQRTGLGPFAAP